MMDLTRTLVKTKVHEYTEEEPLYPIEQEHVETLPEAFRSGQYGRRDAEWVVQWYFRRFLGTYPDAERRATEAAFRGNDFEAVRDALAGVVDSDTTVARLNHLTTLAGVDVPVASAFLQFLFPSRYVVVGEREWSVLCTAGELDKPFPDPLGAEAYLTYHEACRTLADRLDIGAWTLYRALWRLGAPESDASQD